MSVLAGEMTKQSLSAPPAIMRSTRNSLTARGRSVPFSMRLPTGRSSLEKASGWILLPAPAAGMIPHMAARLLSGGTGGRLAAGGDFIAIVDERAGALVRSVLAEGALAGALADGFQFAVGVLEGGDDVVCRVDAQNLFAGAKECVETFPPVGEDRRAARGCFKQPARRAVAILRHGAASDVERSARRAEQDGVQSGF